MNIRQPLITRLLLVAAALLAPASAIAYYGTESLPVPGYVFKQGLVLNDEGKPVFAEYDSKTGNAVNILKDFDASDPALRVVSGAAYQSTREQLITWRDSLVAGVFDKFKVISPKQFKQSDYPDAFQAHYESPYSSSRSLLVYKPEALDSTVSLSEGDGLIVQQSIFNIQQLLDNPQPGTRRSLLIDASGQVIHASDNNIGFRVAFFNSDGSTLQDGERSDSNISGQDLSEGTSGSKSAILAPVQGARISNHFSPSSVGTVSKKNGYFLSHLNMPICPGASYDLSIPITAEVPYRSFNPQRASTLSHYYFWGLYNYSCAGLPLVPPTNLGAQMDYIDASAVYATAAAPILRVGIPVDITLLTGSFSVANPSGPVPVGDATVRLSTPRQQAEYFSPENTDFNNDGEDDYLSDSGSFPPPEGAPADAAPLYGVWFSEPDTEHKTDLGVPLTDSLENGGVPIAPDLIRVALQKQNFDDIGLLEAISYEDLANTDLYVFRQSTGQLVMEKSPFYPEGSGSAASGYGNGVNGISGAGQGYFEVAIPGRDNQHDFRHINSSTDSLADALADPSNKGLKYNAWQATQFVAADFRGETDSLRVGEPLQVVVINRATGYIGIAETAVEAVSQASGQSPLAIPLGDIVLQPPNLKVSVERQYSVEKGLTQGETRRYSVGSEGAALHSDQFVKITTDWRATDGTPLPSMLPGYTGRLISLVADTTLGSSDVSHFGIKPGFKTEVIKLSSSAAVLSTGYQYLHVVGEQDIDSAFFGSSDTTRNRPEKYVPVRVAVYDEPASRARKQAQLVNPENTVEQDSSVYQWPHRPEMMYAVYDLDVKKITRTPGQDSGEGEEAVDISGSATPVIGANDTDLSVVQNLIASEYDPLEYFGPDSHLVYSLEGYQQQVVAGSDRTYSFSDLGHLGNMNSEDFLAINLLNNQDAGNILWEYVFGDCYLIAEKTEVSADVAQVDFVAVCVGSKDGEGNPITLLWRVDGAGGALDQVITVSTDRAFFNTLQTSTKADEEYSVSIRILKSEDQYIHESSQEYSSDIYVRAGTPHRMELVSSDVKLPADTVAETTVKAYVTDKNANPVVEGSEVIWSLDGDGIKSAYSSFVNALGFAELDYTAGILLHDTNVEARSGDAAENIAIEKKELNGDLSVDRAPANLTAGTNQTALFTISTDAADGTPVTWFSTRGQFIEETTEVESGVATARLQAAQAAGYGVVSATLGSTILSMEFPHVSDAAVTLTPELAAIVGEAQAGTVIVDSLEGGKIVEKSYSYPVSTTLHMDGSKFFSPGGGSTREGRISVRVGTPAMPNALPVAEFGFNHIESSSSGFVTKDDTGGSQFNIVGAVSHDVTKSSSMPGTSFAFSGGYMSGEFGDMTTLEGLVVNLSFNTQGTQEVQTLVTHRDDNGTIWALFIDEQGYLRGSAITSTGVRYTTDPELFVSDNQWHRAGLRFVNDIMQVQLDSKIIEQPLHLALKSNGLSEDLALVADSTSDGVGRVYVGENFAGNIDDLRIYREAANNKLLRLPNGGDIDFGVGETATVEVAATGGQLPPTGARVGFSVVETSADGSTYSTVSTSDIAVVKPETWGWSMELIGKGVFGEGFDEVKMAASIAYSVSGVSDVVTLMDAIYKLFTGRVGQVDGFEVGFAAVGLAASIVTVFITGPPGFVLLQSGLQGLKVVLKELFINGAIDLIKSAIALTKYIFRTVGEFVQNPTKVLDELKDFGSGLDELFTSSTKAIANFFSTVRSTDDVLDWLAIRKLDAAGCLVASLDSSESHNPLEYRIAGVFNSITRFFVSDAQAAGDCIKRQEVLFGELTKLLDDAAGDAAQIQRARDSYKSARRAIIAFENAGHVLSSSAMQSLVKIAQHGGRDVVNGFSRSIENWTVGGRTFDWSENSYKNTVDTYIRAIGDVPVGSTNYSKWVKRMGGHQNDITGLYGEARQIRELLDKKGLINADGSLKVDVEVKIDVRLPEATRLGNGRLIKKGSESVDVVIVDERQSQVYRFVGESKVLNSSADRQHFKEQFYKHLWTEIRNKKSDGVYPEIFYRLQGQGFKTTNKDEFSTELLEYVEEVDSVLFEQLIEAGFKFDSSNIEIVVDNAINPIIFGDI